MNLPTTKPNDLDLAWYRRECELLQDRNEALERENAALRGLLQDSLEWLNDYGMRMSGTSNLVSRIETALRKEAQP